MGHGGGPCGWCDRKGNSKKKNSPCAGAQMSPRRWAGWGGRKGKAKEESERRSPAKRNVAQMPRRLLSESAPKNRSCSASSAAPAPIEKKRIVAMAMGRRERVSLEKGMLECRLRWRRGSSGWVQMRAGPAMAHGVDDGAALQKYRQAFGA